MSVRVRLAPSPTGFLHIGTAQSALYNWLHAHSQQGKFLLRIEDTDKERSTKEYEQSILDALSWLDLKYDEELVHQSERTDRYRAALQELLDNGKAFYCHHSQEELETERKSQEAAKQPPRHVCDHKNTDQGKQAGGIIRLNVGAETVSFNDAIRGPIEFKSELLGDFSIAKSLDEPLYNLAVVVDDADMEISTVIRGEDHISNTPKQILIYQMLGKKIPQFAHLPLILAPDRSKLSKRHGATAVVDYKKDYLPEAVINFLGALGYTFSKEILSKEEMVKEFKLENVHKSGAVFDIQKLNWVNSQWIKNLSPSDFKKVSGLADISDAAVPLITERLEKLSDAQTFSYLWQEPEYDGALLIWKDSPKEQVSQSLEATLKMIESGNWEDLRNELDTLAASSSKGLVYWPLRVALSGKDKSPDPVQIAMVLGKDEVVKRINTALGKL